MSDAFRLHDLSTLADAVLGLGHDDTPDAAVPLTVDDMEQLELAAAAVDLACTTPQDFEVPAGVRAALDRAADEFIASQASARPEVVSRVGHWVSWGGWLAAAATVVVATSIFTREPAARTPLELVSTVTSAGDVRRGSWSDWALNGQGPEITGVAGEAVWSESAQRGLS